MRKIAIISIVLLILTSVFPAGAFAGGSDVNNTNQSVQTNNDTGNDSDEAELKTDKETSDVENEEEINEQDSDKENQESDPVENPGVTDSKENTPETTDNGEDNISESQEVSKEDKAGPKEEQEEVEVLEKDQDSDSNEKKETGSEKKEQDSSSDKEEVTTFSKSNTPVVEKSSTSKLGHLRTGSTIYENIGVESSSFSSDDYLNAVYYIKQQAKVSNETYYLISKEPSHKEGVIGWVKASDMSTNSHVGVDSKSKTFYVKGTGSAYTKAWGGSKDFVYDLSGYKQQLFEVDLTEKVGGNIWYRGQLDGKTVWMHNSYVTDNQISEDVEKSSTSKLGHLRTGSTIYESIGDESSSFSSDDYLNAVYYIKQQTKVGDETYYLISKKPSHKESVIGWVKASDMSTHSHVGVDSYSKLFYIAGEGSAYSKAWGGSKDLVYEDLSKHQYQPFEVNLTEEVGGNIWYRGTLNGKTAWVHSSNITTTEVKLQSTSKLGHLRSSGVKIYKKIGDDSSGTTAGEKHINAVYYIKQQADTNGETYYLISNKPSSKEGVVGWVKASDMSTHAHKGVDSKNKTFYFTGDGTAHTKAWGGSKDLVYEDMAQFKGQKFDVHLTETVGSNVWYRGQFNDKEIWLHESYVTSKEENHTSRLGHLHDDAKIYKTIGEKSSLLNTDKYIDAVYYIKQQAEVNDQTYYLISKKPSSTDGIVGWVNKNEMKTYQHKGLDKKDKFFYFTGEGSSYNKAWGGSENLVFKDMSNFAGELFEVHLTETVGSNIWYRGEFEGETIWLHEAYVSASNSVDTQYDLTLDKAVDIQKSAGAKTDQAYAYVSKKFIRNGKVSLNSGVLNVREGPGTTSYAVIGDLKDGDKVTVLGEVDGWYVIEHNDNKQWVSAATKDLQYYLDPLNFLHDKKQQFQFLDLSKSSNVSAGELNSYLKGKGILKGKGQAFIDAALKNGINDIYLASHASLETGNGNSKLANGIEVGKDKKEVLRLVTDKNRENLTAIKKVYNMYGIGAFDEEALYAGAMHAYLENWTTPQKAIIDGASFIGNNYIKSGQNTLYEMRWDPVAMEKTGWYGHQYATDIGWASKQVGTMYNLYQKIGITNIFLDIPVYSK